MEECESANLRVLLLKETKEVCERYFRTAALGMWKQGKRREVSHQREKMGRTLQSGRGN